MNSSQPDEVSNRRIMERAYQLGFKYEQELGACTQCVLAAVQEILNIEDENLFRACYGLGGGVGVSGEGTCGALSGGVLALGYLYGRTLKEFRNGKWANPNDKAFVLSKELYDRFLEEYGGCTCKDVQTKIFGRSFNLRNKQDLETFMQAGGHRDKCTDVTGKAASWTVEIILRENR